MIKNLVAFGCSWTYGDELLDPKFEGSKVQAFDVHNDSYRQAHAYPGLVANHYGWTLEDLSWPGASLQSMLWNFNYWLDNSSPEHIAESIVLVGLTHELRTSWYNTNYKASKRESQHDSHRYIHSVWVKHNCDIYGEEDRMEYWQNLHKMHYTLSDCADLRESNYNTIVRAFDGSAARYNIPMLQFNVLTSNHKLKVPTLLDSSSFLEMLVIRDKPRKDPLFKKGRHPNEKGHMIISDFLINKVNSVILT